MSLKFSLYSIFLLFCFFGNAQSEESFQRANALYNQEKYQEAIESYQSIVANGYESAEVYYNLGNAHYKLSNIGQSIYYYEKALMLSPGDKDIRNNLDFANNATIDAIDSIPEGVISRTAKRITNIFSFDTWAGVSVGFILLFVILFIIYLQTGISLRKRIFFVSSLVFLVFGMMAVALAFKQQNDLNSNQYAIIFATETSVKSEPNLRSEEVFDLHEGTKVKITETVNKWKKVRLADGKQGWLPASDLKEL